MRRFKRRHNFAFVLLEVLVSLAILSIALASAMRSFTISLKAARLSQDMTVATMLARELVEQWEIIPPAKGKIEGDFGPDHPEFTYAGEYKQENIKYEDIPKVNKYVGRLVPLRRISLDVYRNETQRNVKKQYRMLHIETALTDAEKFSPMARVFNQIGFD